jgi:hypothetical protein
VSVDYDHEHELKGHDIEWQKLKFSIPSSRLKNTTLCYCPLSIDSLDRCALEYPNAGICRTGASIHQEQNVTMKPDLPSITIYSSPT